MDQHHSENLLKDAPGLAVKLARILNSDSLKMVVESYAECVRAGGLEEGGVIREEGVSFNPRPARILILMIEDCGISDPEILCRTLKLCASPIEENIKLDTNFSEFNSSIIAACLLDAIRHIHLSKSEKNDKELFLNKANQTLLILNEKISERMRNKLNKAIEQQRRILC